MKHLLIIVFALCTTFFPVSNILAQKRDKQTASAKDSLPAFDTNYYRSYTDRLIIGIFQAKRNYEILLHQPLYKDKGSADVKLTGNINDVTGFDIAYDKFSLSLANRTVASNNPYIGNSKYNSIQLNFGNPDWALETSFRRYKGFYDNNHLLPDSFSKKNNIHYIDPSFLNQSWKAKYLYFFNHKRFSFYSGYSCNFRQLKTAFSWVYVSNLYFTKLSTDSTFVPLFLRDHYPLVEDLHQVNVLGISSGFGASWNLVIFKGLFMNITFLGGLEPQHRTYYSRVAGLQKGWHLSLCGDFRTSIGFNLKRFYLLISSLNDVAYINSKQLELKNKYISGSFTMGFRIKTKTPAFYQRFQQTKLYKLL